MEWEVEYHKLLHAYINMQFACQAELRVTDQTALKLAREVEQYRVRMHLAFFGFGLSLLALLYQVAMGVVRG